MAQRLLEPQLIHRSRQRRLEIPRIDVNEPWGYIKFAGKPEVIRNLMSYFEKKQRRIVDYNTRTGASFAVLVNHCSAKECDAIEDEFDAYVSDICLA